MTRGLTVQLVAELSWWRQLPVASAGMTLTSRGELSRVTGAEGLQRLAHASWVEMLVLNFDFPRFGLCAGQRRDPHRNAAIARPTFSG